MPRPNQPIEKSKNFTKSIKRLVKELSPWHVIIIIAIILAALSAVFSIIAPDKLSELTDEITLGIKPDVSEEKIKEIMIDPSISNEDKQKFMSLFQNTENINKENINEIINEIPESIKEKIEPTINTDNIKKIVLILAILYISHSICSFIEGLLMAEVANRYARKIRLDISRKINKLPLKYFDNHEIGDILSRITNDIDNIAQNLNQTLGSFVRNVVLFIGCTIMMFVTNWIMALSAIVATLIGFSFMSLILKKSQKYFILRQKQLGELNGHIEEIYSGHTIVKVYNGEKSAEKEMDRLNKQLYNSNRKSQFLSGLMPPIMGFCGNLGYVAVCVCGAVLTMNNYISFGVIVAFMVYIRLFTNPLSQIAQSMTSFQSTAASAERVFEFFDEKPMPKEENMDYLDIKDAKGNIEFKHVHFGYDKDKTIINDFNAKVKSGQKIAIVGPTGAGKTTMVNLLMKFYDITDGDIVIDGKSIKNLTRENIHDLFIMVLQDTWLFDGTIRENIKFNKEDISDEEIWNACKVVGVDHFIKTLAGGIDSKINDNDTISQGQKQLLTIARGMVQNSPFLILDEATSNVDTRTEELVQKAMDKLTKGRTSFIIAHRLSTIKNADLILVMKNGDIVEQGKHDDLIKKNGFYAELYNSQFQS